MTVTATVPSRAQPNFILLLVALIVAELTCSLESGMIYAALSGLYKEYGDPVGVSWLITSFTLVSAASAALAGRLGDLYGRRTMMLVMLGFALSGSLISASTRDLEIMILGRALQGASMAILPLGFGVLRESAPPQRLGIGISVIGATYTVGGGLGAVVGGAVVDRFDWEGIFLVSAGMAAIAGLLVAAVVPGVRPQRSRAKIDFAGGALMAPAVGLLLYGVSEGLSHGWDLTTIACAVSGAVLMALWLLHELRAEDPLIDVRQLGRREIGLANLVLASISLGPLLSPAILLPFMQQPQWTGIGFGISAMLAGVMKLPGNAAATIGGLVCGALTPRFGVRTIMLVCAALSASGWFALGLWHDNLIVVFALMSVLIVPTGTIILVLVPQVIIESSPADRTSEATGVSQVVRAFSKAIGTQIIGLSFATAMVPSAAGGKFPAESAYVLTFTICGMLSLACGLLVLGLPKGPRAVSCENSGTTPI